MKNLHRTDPGGYPFQWRQQMPMFGAKSDHGEWLLSYYPYHHTHHCPRRALDPRHLQEKDTFVCTLVKDCCKWFFENDLDNNHLPAMPQ